MVSRRDGSRPAFTAYGFERYHEKLPDTAWVDRQLKASTTRFLIVRGDEHLIVEGGAPKAVTLTGDEARPLLSQTDSVTFLGRVDNTGYVVLGFDPDTDRVPATVADRGHFQTLRHVAPLVDRRTGGLLAYAQAMVHWHHDHRFCGVCGHPTQSAHGGHLRVCTHPACETAHFPRTDPAIIVLVAHEERCLLARQPHWRPRQYSIIAGFVEPVESLEEAVAREVREETGVTLRSMTYQSSQPWPFPKSLMLGFVAQAADPTIHRNDGELEDVRWVSRVALKSALERGEIRLPSSISISRRLITQWFDAGSLGSLASVSQIVE